MRGGLTDGGLLALILTLVVLRTVVMLVGLGVALVMAGELGIKSGKVEGIEELSKRCGS